MPCTAQPAPPARRAAPHQTDQFTSLSQLRAAVAQHDATPGAGPLQVRVLEGADHFPYSCRELVAQQVLGWLAAQLGAEGAHAPPAAAGLPGG